MNISDILRPDLIRINLKSSSKKRVLAELSKLISLKCPGTTDGQIRKKLKERESLATTGIGMGFAIPHAVVEGIEAMSASVGISRTGVHFDAVDGKLVHIFCVILAPKNYIDEHRKLLACASRLFKDQILMHRLLEAKTSKEVFTAIKEMEKIF